MNGFFGEWRADGREVPQSTLDRIAEAIPWYGRDGKGFWRNAGVGIGVLQRHSTPESRHESPIQVTQDGFRVLAGSYRIDNRDQLVADLGLKSAEDRPLTDGELILAAHAEWGDGGPGHLIGDFAFVIWDVEAQRLLIVRDQIGIVPLFYFETPSGVIFGNDLRALAAHPDGPRELNPIAIAHHLRDPQYLLGDASYLAGVRRLRPGHVLLGDGDGFRARRYWHPQHAPAVVLPDAAAYAAQLRGLFEQAVASRLRVLEPVGAHVSGGLDSTAVALEAQRQLAARGDVLAGAYSWLPNDGGPDDRSAPEYVATRHAEAALGMTVEGVDLTSEGLLREFGRNIALNGYTDLWYEPLVRQQASKQGIQTILSGWGGDEVVTSGVRGYGSELFWTGRWIRLLRLARWRAHQIVDDLPQQAARPVWRRALGFLYAQVFLPSLPAFVFRAWPGTRTAPLPDVDIGAPLLASLGGRPPPTQVWQTAVGKRAEMCRALTAGHLQDRIEAWWMQGARDGIHYAYPLLDRRLIEFCLGAPPELFVGPVRTRWLFREAMRGLLPDAIRLGSVKIEAARVAALMDSMCAAMGVERAPSPGVLDFRPVSRVRRLQADRMRVDSKPLGLETLAES